MKTSLSLVKFELYFIPKCDKIITANESECVIMHKIIQLSAEGLSSKHRKQRKSSWFFKEDYRRCLLGGGILGWNKIRNIKQVMEKYLKRESNQNTIVKDNLPPAQLPGCEHLIENKGLEWLTLDVTMMFMR